MLTVVFAHQHEILQAQLLDSLDSTKPGPFGQHEIIIPSVALARDIRLAASRRFGIAANLRFSYLAAWLWEQMACFVTVPAVSPYAPAALVWRILQALDALPLAEHPRLAQFCAAAEPLTRYQLAQRLASLFDQYLTYRPQWIRNWSRKDQTLIPDHPDAGWQAALWQHIRHADDAEQPPLLGDFFSGKPLPSPTRPLPQRVHVFGLPNMPPVYLSALTQLGQKMDITLYVRNPCREYWLDTQDAKRLARLATQGLSGSQAHRTLGNRLLAAWGVQTRDYLGQLLTETGEEVDYDDRAFAAADFPKSVLGQLQSAIFHLQDLSNGCSQFDNDDRSIELHICHSLTRQLDVLHDQLLSRFTESVKQGAPLKPADVLVAVPDLEAAAPLIHAVFSSVPPHRFIPYTITGSATRQSNPLAQALAELIDVVRSRWQAESVLNLLHHPAIARRYQFNEDDLATLTHWIRESGIRWGRDAQHQRTSCAMSDNAAAMPDIDEALPRHSFAWGLERLFLGFALPAEDQLFAEALPYSALEGSDAWLLGRFYGFIDTLGHLQTSLMAARTPAEWQQCFGELLSQHLQAADDEQDALQTLRHAIRTLAGNMVAAGTHTRIAPEIALTALGEALDQANHGGVPGGQVTFTALSSLRGLPYRLICLLGLDGQVFPAIGRSPEFDLMAARPHYGDRQRRDDDRNLFLDALLNARENLYLSYTGRDQRDNSPLPASILIDELFDYLEAAAGRRLPAWRVTHPLQAFSPRYFTPTQADGQPTRGIFSYAEEICTALLARIEAANTPASPFFSTPLPALPHPEVLEVQTLHDFLAHPARALLRQRLGLSLPWVEEAIADAEPLLPGYRERDALTRRALPTLLAPASRQTDWAKTLAAAPEAPWGALGEALVSQQIESLTPFAGKIQAITHAEPRVPPLAFTLRPASQYPALQGQLTGCFEGGLLRFHAGPQRARDLIAAWLDHLILCALAQQNGKLPSHTRLLCLDGETRLRPVAEPLQYLATLLEAWSKGQTQALPFFPKTAWAAANGQDPTPAWTGGQYGHGERDEPWNRLAWRDTPDPLGPDFLHWSHTLLAPLIAHLDDGTETESNA